MIPLNAIKLIGLSLIAPLLAACGDSKISAVKDTRLRGDEFTVGEMLSKIKECKSTDWTSEVVNNATMVTHTCTVRLDDELRDLAKQGELAALKTRSDLADLSVTQALSQARSVHADALRYSQERASLATKRLAELDQRIERSAATVYSPVISMRGLPTAKNAPEADRAAWDAQKSAGQAVLAGEREKLLAEIEAEKQKNQTAIDAALKQIEDASAWNEKYGQEIARTYEAVTKEVEAYYDKSHTLKVQTVFRYREGGNAEPVSASLFIDDLEGRSATPVYLMDPKRMREYLGYLLKNGMGMGASQLFDERFPIERTSGPDGGFRYKSSKPAI